jgi:nucleolar protein TMA23
MMNARSILESYGWGGPGHPLHPNAYQQKGHRGLAYDPNVLPSTAFASSGLIKPLLVSKKQGNLGVGRKAHEPQAGNEWWLKGFEKALSDVGKSESERSSGVSTPVAATPAAAGKFGALYTYFVSGGKIAGSLEEDDTNGVSTKRGKKRKSDKINGDDEQGEFKTVAAFMEVRDQDVKRRKRKKNKKSAEEEFQAVEAFMEVRDHKARNKRKSEAIEADNEQPEETKEQRRERRRQRRAGKEAANPNQTPNSSSKGDDVAKALRKAEKKRRKAEGAAREP